MIMKNNFKEIRAMDNFYQSSSFFPMPLTLVGTLDENGKYPEGSINYLVSEKLKKYAQNSAKYN